MLLSSQKLYFTICSCGNRQSLRPLRRRQGACLFLPSYRPALCPSSMGRACAAPSYAARASFPIRPHAARRFGRLCAGARRPQLRPGRLSSCAPGRFPFHPMRPPVCAPGRFGPSRPCAPPALWPPAAAPGRLPGPPRARAPPAFRPAFLRLRAQPAPAFAPPARFFLLCRALSHAQRPPACAKIRSFPFFPSRFSSASFRTLFSVRGPGPMHREKRPPGCAPGGPAAHAARCISP